MGDIQLTDSDRARAEEWDTQTSGNAFAGGYQSPAAIFQTAVQSSAERIARGSDYAPPLPAEKEGEKLDPARSGPLLQTARGQERKADLVGAPELAGKPKGVPHMPFWIRGQKGMTNTPAELADMVRIEQREVAAARANAIVVADEAQASSDAFAAMTNLGAYDSEQLYGFINEDVPRWREANRQLTEEVDAARAMRIDQNRYLGNLGRSGRAAAAIAMGIAQLSAGHGNPNLIANRIDAAIERDISEQESNMKQVWLGLKNKGAAIDREMALLDQEFVWRDRARAVAYTSYAAEMERAKHQARSEGARIAAQMVEDRAKYAKYLYIGQTRAKTTQIGINTAAINRAQLERYKQAWDAAQGIVSPADPAYGTREEQSVTLSDGRVVTSGDGQPVSPTQGVPVPGEAAEPTRPTSPASRRARRPSAAASRPRPDGTTRPPTEGAPAGETEPSPGETPSPELPEGWIHDEVAGVTREMTPLEKEQYAATMEMEAEAERERRIQANLQERRDIRAQGGDHPAMQNLIAQSLRTRASVEAGGHGRAWAIKNNIADWSDVPTLKDAVTMLVQNPANKRLAIDINDAKVLARVDAAMNWPQRSDFKTDEKYEAAIRLAEFRRDHPMQYLQPRNLIDADGKNARNYIVDTSMGPLFLRDPLNWKNTTDARKVAQAVRIKANSAYKSFESLYEMAKSMDKLGPGTFLGIGFGEDGLYFTPTNGAMRAELYQLQSLAVNAGINAIKNADPNGRLTDKDIEVGQFMVNKIISSGAVKNSWEMTLAWLQELQNTVKGIEGWGRTEIMKSIRNYFAGIAMYQLKQVAKDPDIGGIVEFDFAASQAYEAQAAEMDRFLQSIPDESKLAGKDQKYWEKNRDTRQDIDNRERERLANERKEREMRLREVEAGIQRGE